MNRFYNDFSLLNVWDSKGVFFIVRHKENIQYTVIKENKLPEDKHSHLLKDELIELKNESLKTRYPKQLHRIAIWDEENNQTIELITNHFKWVANTIGELYKSRWNIEIFFGEIKQLLHIKTFIGISENAVLLQIRTTLITILVLKALKARTKFDWHLSNLVAFVRLNVFVKIGLLLWLDKPFEEHIETVKISTQGVLF